MILMVLLSPLGLLALLLSMERIERWTIGDGNSAEPHVESGYADGPGPTVTAAAPQ
jgi:hypothetical protein